MTDPPTPSPPTGRRRIILAGAGTATGPERRSAPGVANRLWNFLRPALEAGHQCLVLSIENEVPLLGPSDPFPAPVACGSGLYRWERMDLRAENFFQHDRLIELVRRFDPHVVAGAGTILAASTACAIAGDRPVWVDFFGDPLAEIQAKAEVMGDHFPQDDLLHVWRLMLQALTRGDAFSVVSRRQADALLGQLALAGRLAFHVPPSRDLDPLAPTIHAIPCCLESMDLFPEAPDPDRAGLLAGAGLPPDARVALWSGGFNAWADPQTLVEGVGLAMDRDPALHLVATGADLPGYLSRVYEDFMDHARRSRHRDRIHALGWLPAEEAHRWLRVADVGLLVDRPCAETRLGARNRLLYFAAARAPVVATRGAEVVEQMEAAGALAACAPGEPSALAETIARLLASPETGRRIADAAYEYCRSCFVFSATARPFLDFVARAARRPAASQPTDAAARRIADYLDVEAREAERLRLARERRSPLARMKDRFFPSKRQTD